MMVTIDATEIGGTAGDTDIVITLPQPKLLLLTGMLVQLLPSVPMTIRLTAVVRVQHLLSQQMVVECQMLQ